MGLFPGGPDMNRSTLFGFLIIFTASYHQVFAQGIELIGSCDLPDKAWGVQVLGEYAFVACDSSGLQVIDISDPVIPVIVATYNTPGIALDVFISDDYAFLADNSSLQIIDISNPLSPAFDDLLQRLFSMGEEMP